MAVQTDEKLFFTFVAGLNSESGWFTAPPNTWRVGDNVVPNIDGVLRKRRALDYEDNYELYGVTSSTVTNDKQWAYATGYWDAVRGNGDHNLLVVQAGPTIHFYAAVSGTVSGRKLAATVDLTPHQLAGNPSVIGTSPIRCVTAAGKLIIVSQDTVPLLCEYVDNTLITATPITLKFRDFEGIRETDAVEFNPTTLTGDHNYNLFNQGWTTAKINQYFASQATYPSNTQSWIYGKNASDDFDPALLIKQDFGTSRAASGRFVLDLLRRDRALAMGTDTSLQAAVTAAQNALTAAIASGSSAAIVAAQSNLVTAQNALATSVVNPPSVPVETEAYAPSACTFFAGRVWYAGVKSDTIGNWVMFSKVSITSNKFGECYQEQDPTSEVLNDLVDSDGGVVPIQDCGEIVALLASANGVIVFASNGVWKIAGTLNTGFSATSYEVTKLSSVGCVGPRSVVVTDGGIMYWSYNGIYSLEPGQNGALNVVNYSDTVIKTFYNSIPSLGKKYSEGVYNPADKTVTWVFTDNLIEDSGASYRWRKDAALIFDLRLKSFYTMTFQSLATESPYIVSPVITKETGEVDQEFDVTEFDLDQIVTSGGDTVIVDLPIVGNGNASLKFLTTRFTTSLTLSFSDLLTETDAPGRWRDWYSANGTGVPYASFVETSYTPGPTGFHKNHASMYVTTFMERTETDIDANGDPVNTSGALMRGKWHFTDSTASNKWGPQQQVYRSRNIFLDNNQIGFDDGFPLVIAKSKVRGRGKALQLRFDAEADKDMRLAGWAVQQLGNTNT